MATFDPLPDDDRAKIAGRIGEWISTTPRFADKVNEKLELGESFQVWMLGLDQLAQGNQRLALLAKDTKRWHHQIRIDGRAEAFARTVRADKPEAGWKMMQLGTSRLTQHIDEAISWLDHNAPDDARVRLLEIPAYHAQTFWLENAKECFLVLVHIAMTLEELQLKHLYSSADFLKTLLEHPPAGGALQPPTIP